MREVEQLFDRGWIAVSGGLWENPSTYTTIPPAFLPKVEQATEDLRWLDAVAQEVRGLIDETSVRVIKQRDLTPLLDMLVAEAHERYLHLPDTFVRFMQDTALQRKVPTCTDCYLDLSEHLIPLPEIPGCHLLRFMNDPQCCVLWYLCLLSSGEACVLASPYFFEPDIFSELHAEDITRDDLLHHTRLCADSFTEFLYRFWIENTICFSCDVDLPFAPLQAEYWRRVHP